MSSVNPESVGYCFEARSPHCLQVKAPSISWELVQPPDRGTSDFKDGGLLHATDYEPSRIYANTGDINAADRGRWFYQYFAEQTWVRAGRDIS